MLNFNFADIFRDNIGVEVKKVIDEMPSDKRPDQIQKIFDKIQDAIKSNKVDSVFVESLRETLIELFENEEIERSSSLFVTRVMGLLTIMGEPSPLSVNQNFIAKHGTERITSIDLTTTGAGLALSNKRADFDLVDNKSNSDTEVTKEESVAMTKTSKNYKK